MGKGSVSRLLHRLSPQKRSRVWVTTANLAGLLAAYAAIKNGLSVIITESPGVTDSPQTGFDSLAPEGHMLLRHLLDETQIASITCGEFAGIHREGRYDVFEDVLGVGLQLQVEKLKSLLRQLLLESGAAMPGECATSSALSETGVTFELASGKQYRARWCLDSSGLNSIVSEQTPDLSTRPMLIRRALVPMNTSYRNRVEFVLTPLGWAWNAYDRDGSCTRTEYSASFVVADPDHDYFDCRWYSRERYTEGCALLLAPTIFRFDPAAGLGITLQLRSALLAARCLCQVVSNRDDFSTQKAVYENELKSCFHDVRNRLNLFYESELLV